MTSGTSGPRTALGFPRMIEVDAEQITADFTPVTLGIISHAEEGNGSKGWGDTIAQPAIHFEAGYTVEERVIIGAHQAKGDLCALRLSGILGVGGEGYVSLGEQLSLSRHVAVKRLIHRDDPLKAKRLIEEARLTGSLEHPNIIPIHALVETEEGEPLIVMKRVEGRSWEDELVEIGSIWRGDTDARLHRHINILLQVCRAVEFAHSRGILHLDIKPENVMLGDYGEVYLVDWGIALREEDREKLPVGRISGTPNYMASEMTVSLRDVSRLSDVFCIGATFHRVLMGHPRYQGDSIQAVFEAARRADAVSYPAGFHSELSAILNKACARDPQDRYSSVQSLREAIESYTTHSASIDLTRQAEVILQALINTTERSKSAGGLSLSEDEFLKRALSCRIAFERALESWPQNQNAIRGLKQLKVRWAVFELSRGHLRSAEAILNEMASPPASLVQQLNEQLSRVARQTLEHARLQGMADDFSFRSTSKYQQLAITLNGLFWSSALMAVGSLNRSGVIKFDQQLNWKLSTYAGIFVLIGLGFYWSLFTDTRWRQRFTAAYASYLTLVYSLRPLSYALDIQIEQSLVFDAAILALFNSQLGALIHPMLWVSTLICIGVTLSCFLAPAWALEALAIGVLTSNLCLAVALGSPRSNFER